MKETRAESTVRTVSREEPRESLQNLSESVGQALLTRGWSMAAAESCTGGWITKLLTEVPGSSRYVRGGIVAYADRAKVTLLGVPEGVIRRHGAVSEKVARAMATGVAERLDADAGVAVTGIAGPAGGSDDKPIGTVWFGIAVPWGVHSERAHFEGNREDVRESAVRHALLLLLRAVANEHGGEEEPEDR